MDKEIIKAMATKFSEIFAIIMLKKHRKFCRRGLTHLAATPTFQKLFRFFWVTLYGMQNDDRLFAIHSSTISSDTIYDLQISLNHGFQQIGDTLGDKKWLSDLFVKA